MQVNRTLVAGLASVAVAATGLVGSARTVERAPVRADTGSAVDQSRLRMNHLQQIGTHNSYHRELTAAEKQVQQAQDPGAANLFYSHASIPAQLDGQKVRALELDLFPDPAGGLYRYPLIRRLTGLGPLADPALDRPGLKVLHIADLDYNSTCRTFVSCLRQVKGWSRAHPGHTPIVIQLELKQSDPRIVAAGGVQSPPWSATELDGIDREIRTVFDERHLLTPDDVRRRGLTLEQSVLRHGWPTLGAARGKVLFFLDNGGPGEIRDTYRAGRPNLEGRAVFTRGPEGQPDAAVAMVNDPRGAGTAEIQRLVRKGYLVRTRSDEPVSTVLANELSRVAAALRSGAHIISSDFPVAGMAARYDSDFVARLPGDAAVHCNPVVAPSWCRTALRER